MHISDGILTGKVVIATGSLSVVGVAIGIYKVEMEKIPKTGILSALFFVASLIHIPIGISSVHLLLNGLLGFLLGWMAFPALLTALLLQAIVFGFGGILSLGANVLVMSVPAVICYYLFARAIKPDSSLRKVFILSFLSGFFGVFLAVILLAVILFSAGKEFTGAAIVLMTGHIPVMLIEGFVTATAVGFLFKVQPSLLTCK